MRQPGRWTPEHGPPPPARRPRITRETRLLLLTIGVSVAALLLLARFRFPAQTPIVNPAPLPLERLAARATYDELATIMAQLQARVQPGMVVLHVAPAVAGADAATGMPQYVPAIRVGEQLALAWLGSDAQVQGLAGSETAVPVVLSRDRLRRLALVRVPPAAEVPAWLREQSPTPRVPGYFAVAEGGHGGVALRPLYLARLDALSDPRWPRPLLLMGGEVDAAPGSFVFTLEGRLVGLVIRDQGMRIIVPPGMLEQSVTRLNQGETSAPGHLGIAVQALSPALVVATGAQQGVVVSQVATDGPAAAALRVGDVIQTLDGEPTYSLEAFEYRLSTIPAGMVATIGFIRRGKAQTAGVTAEPRAPQTAAGTPPATGGLGLTLRAAPTVGTQVLHVKPQSAGARAGLQAGDFITSLDAIRTPTPAQNRTGVPAGRRGRGAHGGYRAGRSSGRGRHHEAMSDQPTVIFHEVGSRDPIDAALRARRGAARFGRLDLLLRTRAALGLKATPAPALVLVPLGVILGPHVLNLFSPNVLAHLDAVVSVALAALGVFVGLALDIRSSQDRRLALAADLESGVTVVIVAAATLLLLHAWQAPVDAPPLAIALALGICASASSGGAAEVRGSLYHVLATHIAELDDVMPIAVGGFVIVALRGATLSQTILFAGLTVLLGLLVGIAGWLLFERAHDAPERGVFIVGTVVLLGGLTAYLSLSPLLAGMVAGVFWRLSPGSADRIIRSDLQKIQHPLVLLLLLTAGASLEWSRLAIWLFAPFVLFRVTGKLTGAKLAERLSAPLTPAELGAYLLPPGVIGIAFALNVQQVASPVTGAAIVTAVAAGSLACELLALIELPGRERET